MNLGFYEIIYIVLAVCALFYTFMFIKLRKHHKGNKKNNSGVYKKNKMRYTLPETPVTSGSDSEEKANVTFEEKDISLRKGYKYVVGPKNKVKPGKYTLLTSEDNMPEFNIRYNGYVKSYKHNSGIVLTEGDEVTSINITLILR